MPFTFASILFVVVAVAGCSGDSTSKSDCDAEDPADCATLRTPELDGTWRLSTFKASGNWSKGAEETAAGFLGKHVKIDNLKVSLPNGTKCRIVSAGPTIVRDSIETFGSPNGSWKKMGFEPMSEGLYTVEEVHFDCDEMFWGIVMQPERNLRLLKVWEVFLTMKKVG